MPLTSIIINESGALHFDEQSLRAIVQRVKSFTSSSVDIYVKIGSNMEIRISSIDDLLASDHIRHFTISSISMVSRSELRDQFQRTVTLIINKISDKAHVNGTISSDDNEVVALNSFIMAELNKCRAKYNFIYSIPSYLTSLGPVIIASFIAWKFSSVAIANQKAPEELTGEAVFIFLTFGLLVGWFAASMFERFRNWFLPSFFIALGKGKDEMQSKLDAVVRFKWVFIAFAFTSILGLILNYTGFGQKSS